MDWRKWRDRLIGTLGGGGPVLTRARIGGAYTVAIVTDTLQFLLGPFGWAFSDEILDIIALIVTTKLLGFHPLLLPTFVLEMIPLADALPTWTACVALVVTLRKKATQINGGGDHPVTIDVKPTSVT